MFYSRRPLTNLEFRLVLASSRIASVLYGGRFVRCAANSALLRETVFLVADNLLLTIYDAADTAP